MRNYFEKGWASWKKHEALFPHPNFIFVEEEVLMHNEKMLQIFLINKTSLKKCLKKHEKVFQEVLGEGFSPEDFVLQIEQKKPLLSLINKDESLLGIILGFNVESSKAFYEKHKPLPDGQIPLRTEIYDSVMVPEPQFCKIFPISFAGNPHSQEVQDLVKQYELELEKIWLEYKISRNPTKLVLEKLSQ